MTNPTLKPPNEGLPRHLLHEFTEKLRWQMGLHFDSSRTDDLERRLRAASTEFGFAAVEACLHWLVTTPFDDRMVEILSTHFTVGETYFFRHPEQFEILEGSLLPALKVERSQRRKRIRIWSAGCCTGEEAYSIAIACRRALPDIENWHITVLATDVNTRYLRKAAKGVFTEWSFREAPPLLKANYFTSCGEGLYALREEIRHAVTFQYLNLAEDPFPSFFNNTYAMDIIFCRNVLMYFSPSQAQRVLDRLYHSLADGGYLVMGPSDLHGLRASRFGHCPRIGNAIYRKEPAIPAVYSATPPPAAGPLQNTAPIDSPSTARAPDSHSSGLSLRTDEAPGHTGEKAVSRYDAAVHAYEEGRYDAVIASLGKLLEDHRESRPAHETDVAKFILLARACANQGDLESAREWCEKAIEADRTQSAHHYLHATILDEQNEWNEAQEALRKALYLDPSFVIAHVALANLYRRRGILQSANRSYGNALALLQRMDHETVLPESDGITAGRMAELIMTMLAQETLLS